MGGNEDALLENAEEPVHGCCTRCILCPLSIASFVPAAFFLIGELIAQPIICLALVCCKVEAIFFLLRELLLSLLSDCFENRISMLFASDFTNGIV